MLLRITDSETAFFRGERRRGELIVGRRKFSQRRKRRQDGLFGELHLTRCSNGKCSRMAINVIGFVFYRVVVVVVVVVVVEVVVEVVVVVLVAIVVVVVFPDFLVIIHHCCQGSL